MNSMIAAQPSQASILTIQPVDASNFHDLNRVDRTFTIDSRLVPFIQERQIGYSVEPVQPHTKRYPAEKYDWTTFIVNPDKAIYLAYVDGQLAGQIILWKNWNGYGYIEDIAVDASFRRQGIGQRLIEQAVGWAKSHALPGLMLETQDNNVAACRLYASCGFHPGGFDLELYQVINPDIDEIALYWYLIF